MKQNNVKLECAIVGMNFLTPTKQFRNSKKDTYNCKLVIPRNNDLQLLELTSALNNAKTDGLQNLWESIDHYPTGLVYPTKYEKDFIHMVACTFFKPKIIDLKGNELSHEQVAEIESNGKFYGIVDVSFYPYLRGTGYGIGTNLNQVIFISNDIPEQEKEQNEMNTTTSMDALTCTQQITINRIVKGIPTTFDFHLLQDATKHDNTFMVVQDKTTPNTYNIGLHDAKFFDTPFIDAIIKNIIEQVEQNTIWNNSQLYKNEISQMYNWTIGTIKN